MPDDNPNTIASRPRHTHLIDSAWKQVEAMWPTLITNRDSSDAGVRDELRAMAAEPSALSIPGYRVQREIHRGGQGIVYEALQHSTGRTVAIKVTRQGPLGGRAGRLRFEREVQILAQLKHPGIVTIYDSGQVAGWDYFVMDYIDGLPLDRHVEERKPSIRERLSLFSVVCTAVNIAHLRGVIHRDLKPGNIRVDRSGAPHVLDFGLAKLVDGLDEDASAVTLTGQFVGSVPWASPEQAEGRLNDLDVRTDVYSLGVLLYQLLTGRFPYDVTGSIRAVSDRIVREAPTDPRRFNAALDDEIATIALTCLRKEPERRYQNAGEVGRDIERYLRGEAIAAKRDSFAYVLRKQMARYRLAAMISGAFVVIVLLALIASLTFWLQAVDARNDESAQRAAAEQNATLADSRARQAADETRKAQAVSGFLTDLLAAADPFGGVRRDVTVADTLDGAARRIDAGKFAGQPDVEAAVRQAIGASYAGLGHYEAAGTQFEAARRALEPLRTSAGRALEWVACTNKLAMVLRRAGRADEAEALLRTALEFGTQQLGADSAAVAQSQHGLACILRDRSDFAESEALFQAALRSHEARQPRDTADYLHTLGDYASLLHNRGDYAQAREFRQRCVELGRAHYGDSHAAVATALANLGTTLVALADYPAAEAVFREALEMARATYGEGHVEFPGFLNNLHALARQGRTSDAGPLMRQALELRRRALGAGHPGLIPSLNNVALIAYAAGDLGDAAALFEESLDILSAAGREHDSTFITLLNNLAGVRRACGDYAACERLLRDSVERGAALLGPTHPTLASNLNSLGVTLSELGQFDEAEARLRAALEIRQAVLGDDHPDTLATLGALGRLFAERGDAAQAESILSELLERSRAGGKPLDAAQALNDLAIAVERRDAASAEAMFREAFAIRAENPGERHAQTLETQNNLSRLLRTTGRPAEAEALARQVVEAATIALPAGHPHHALYQAQHALCLADLGRMDEAVELLRDAYPPLEAAYGTQHRRTRDVAAGLAQLLERTDRAAEAAAWRARAAPLPTP